MTVLHIIDYSFDDAQAARLVEEVVNRLPEPEYEVGLVSYGDALVRFGALAGRLQRPASLIETPTLGHRFAVALGQDAQFMGKTTHEVLDDTFHAADLVWFPSVHHHLFDSRQMIKAVASFHDPAPLELAEFLADKSGPAEAAGAIGMAAQADMATRRLMGSLAGVAAGSQRIAEYLVSAYAPKFRRPKAVPLPTPSLLAERGLPLAVPATPYILYAGDIGPTGNHESLFTALASLKQAGTPLVLALAGEGTDRIATGTPYREAYLRGLIEHLGLEIGTDIRPLGPLAPGALKSAFAGAAGAILPALAEGPAMLAAGQALELGLPLAAADLPALRAYFSRRGAAPSWFAPASAAEIANALFDLSTAKHEKAGALPDSSWDEVAAHYRALFREQAIFAATQTGGR